MHGFPSILDIHPRAVIEEIVGREVVGWRLSRQKVHLIR